MDWEIFLQSVTAHGQDLQWVKHHRKECKLNLYDGLENELTIPDAVRAFKILSPSMMKLGWFKLVESLLHEAAIRTVHMTEREKAGIWLLLADFKRRKSDFNPAEKSYEKAEQIARNEGFKDVLLEAVIGRLWFKTQEQGQTIEFDEVHNALELADRVQNDVMTAQLYQVLAYRYANAGDLVNCLLYGELALQKWQQTQHKDAAEQMAEVASAMASACIHRPKGDPAVNDAMVYLDRASAFFTKTSNRSQYTKFAYLYGSIKRKEQKFEAAAQWFFKALEEYQMLEPIDKSPQREACIYHMLGYSLIHTEQISRAEEYLLYATDLWTHLEDSLQVAAVYNDLGILQRKLKKNDLAFSFFELAKSELKTVKETERRKRLQEIVQQNLDDLNYF